MHGLALIYILREEQGIRNFKIVQESLDYTRILIESASPLTSEVKARIVSKFKERLGNSVSIDIIEEDNISPESSGKFRYIQSKVGNSL